MIHSIKIIIQLIPKQIYQNEKKVVRNTFNTRSFSLIKQKDKIKLRSSKQNEKKKLKFNIQDFC